MMQNDAPTPDSALQDCDLVMKGGITSGVVYPAAVATLAEKYRFINVGGASAGAIAAAAVAAAEYGRNRPGGGFTNLAQMSAELAQKGFLEGLFAPTKTARPVFRLLLRLQRKKRGPVPALRKALGAFATLVWGLAGYVAVGALLALVLLAALINQTSGLGDPTWIGWALLMVLVGFFACLGLMSGIGLRARRLVVRDLPDHFFGLSTGMPTDLDDDGTAAALTPWLHEKIQRLAGRAKTDLPLTFADLGQQGIALKVMTTDVSQARPVQFPDGASQYWYRSDEFDRLFPRDVVAAMRAASQGHVQRGAAEYRQLPAPAKLPVLVATRMSLSFPVLLSAVPLYSFSPSGKVRRHWISDGGISSNFPIHFFDSWVPRRPTLALSFLPASRAGQTPEKHDPCSPEAPPVAHGEINSVVGFLSQILDTMQNWRDTLQSELPGFKDRVEPVRLEPDEGGMNLTMPPPVIERLAEKGVRAGRELKKFDWERHRFHRYRLTMRLLHKELGKEGSLRTPEAEAFLARLGKGDGQFVPCGCAPSRRWRSRAARQTRSLIRAVSKWDASFVEGPEHLPPSVLRRTPEV